MTFPRPSSAPSHDTKTDTSRTVHPQSTRTHTRTNRSARHLAVKGATGATRFVLRGTVLATIAAVGVAVPLVGNGPAEEVPSVAQPQTMLVGENIGPDLLTFLEGGNSTTILSSNVAPVVEVSNPYQAASIQTFEDTLLDDCDPTITTWSSNGRFTDAELCDLSWNEYSLSPRAAISLTALNESFRSEFDRDLCLVSGYRTLSAQQRLAVTRGRYAATPGRSNHGLGLAIDLCSSETSSREVWSWLHTYGPIYGWKNPPWAQRGGNGPYEPWHWEFEDAFTSDSDS